MTPALAEGRGGGGSRFWTLNTTLVFTPSARSSSFPSQVTSITRSISFQSLMECVEIAPDSAISQKPHPAQHKPAACTTGCETWKGRRACLGCRRHVYHESAFFFFFFFLFFVFSLHPLTMVLSVRVLLHIDSITD